MPVCDCVHVDVLGVMSVVSELHESKPAPKPRHMGTPVNVRAGAHFDPIVFSRRGRENAAVAAGLTAHELNAERLAAQATTG